MLTFIINLKILKRFMIIWKDNVFIYINLQKKPAIADRLLTEYECIFKASFQNLLLLFSTFRLSGNRETVR